MTDRAKKNLVEIYQTYKNNLQNGSSVADEVEAIAEKYKWPLSHAGSLVVIAREVYAEQKGLSVYKLSMKETYKHTAEQSLAGAKKSYQS